MIIDKNNNLLNKSKTYEIKNNTEQNNIFSDFYLIGFILFIALCFIMFHNSSYLFYSKFLLCFYVFICLIKKHKALGRPSPKDAPLRLAHSQPHHNQSIYTSICTLHFHYLERFYIKLPFSYFLIQLLICCKSCSL